MRCRIKFRIPLFGGGGGRTNVYAGGGAFIFFNDEPRGEILGEGEGADDWWTKDKIKQSGPNQKSW